MGEGEKALEERIRHRAYELWEEAGRPHGQSEKYWQQARAELEADAGADVPGGSARWSWTSLAVWSRCAARWSGCCR